ncbi:MAG TPA: ubiquinol-cytochrome C chaperone family protein [Sphingomicrobium sp.]
MLGSLFRRLTAEPARGSPLFDALTRIAREPHWYVEGEVPDTLDGRFGVLATVLAIIIVRLERDGRAGNAASVRLTERFIEVMESEHRELGLGDPTLGKTVRKLVGMLARKTELWRSTLSTHHDWTAATRQSLYKDEVPAHALRHSGDALQRFVARIGETSLGDLEQGNIA